MEDVRAAARALEDSADRVFDLVDDGRRSDAIAELEAVEETVFEPFAR